MLLNIKPDRQKAISLRKMAHITLQRLNQTDINSYPSNALLDYYDIIHNLLEAALLEEGIKIKGEGAHKELIEYAVKRRLVSEQERVFLQQMKDHRNRISYEGFSVSITYIANNQQKIVEIIKRMMH
jgi:hypothetical protein